MKEQRSLHLQVQEMCDCYATTDPLEEMAKMASVDEGDLEAAVKWLSLAILHGINNNAEEITVSREKDGGVRVTAEYRKTELPAMNGRVAEAVMAAVREITHIDADKGRLPLSIGIRDSSVDLEVKIKSKEKREKLKLKFK